MADPDYKHAWAGDKQYVARGDGKQTKVWIVTTQARNATPQGVKRVAAYFSEKLARAHAAKLVGAELIGLESIDVLDLPHNAS